MGCCCRPKKPDEPADAGPQTIPEAEPLVGGASLPSVPGVPRGEEPQPARSSRADTVFASLAEGAAVVEAAGVGELRSIEEAGGELLRRSTGMAGSPSGETVQNLTQQGDVLFAGFLRKMKVGKNWKTRWCVLTDQRITYFRGKQGDTEKAQGHIDLAGAEIEETVADGIINTDDPEFQHAFCIKTKGKGADFVFACMSDSEKEVWLVAFAQAARCEPPARLSTSTSLSSMTESASGEDEGSLEPMSPVEIFASLCCFRVQQRFIHRVLHEEKRRTFGGGSSTVAFDGIDQPVGWAAVPSVADWPLMAGWLDKKGRTRKGWKLRWVVIVGPFLSYYESPEEHFAGKVLKGEEGFAFLGDFELLDHTQLSELTGSEAGAGAASSMLLSNVDKIAVTQHGNCVALASRNPKSKWFNNPLLLELGPGSSLSIDDWSGAMRQAIALAATFPSEEAAVERLVESSTMRHMNSKSTKPHLIVADASLIPSFEVCGMQDQRRMLTALDAMITFPPATTKEELELAQWQRQLVRVGWLTGVDLGAGSDGKAVQVMVFLLENMLLVVEPHGEPEPSSQLHTHLMYRQHQLLKESTDVSDLSALAFMVATGSRSYRFSAPDERSKQMWLRDLYGLLHRQSTMHNMLDRYLGAVIFADVSGFSNLGDALERREHQEQAAAKKAGGKEVGTPGAATASEELARILGKEVEKMVEDVTRGGGDVIKFAGDCVIAVFPAEQYMDLPMTNEYGSLALATGQAVRVSVQMMHAKNMFLLKSQQHRAIYGDDDEISRLVSALNIHIAIGSGEVFGYHVGGVESKWDYLISGPVMEQVRSADSDTGAGEVVLSKEAYELLKRMKMRKTFLKSGNVKLETYFGPTEEPPFRRPWEIFKDKPELCEALAKHLSSYVPKPVVSQVEAGNTLWLAAKKQISTIFCRLIGIDYVARQGETAVIQLGEIITQVQTILVSDQGTLTRVISDDKGTSMLMAFSHPQHAVDAAMAITTAVEAIPVPANETRFRTAIGITTGVVFYGPVGGRIRAEHTMHGSVVNFSARLMTCPLIKNSGGILCDDETAKLASKTEFVAQAPRHFKGFEEDVVSYMPTRRVVTKARRSNATQSTKLVGSTQIDRTLERELNESGSRAVQVTAAPSSVDWVSRLEPALKTSPRHGCIIAVETDFPGHWNLAAIKEAVTLHVPTVAIMNLVFNDQDQQLNSVQLNRQLKTSVPADTCLILEKANVLNETNWRLLVELCETVVPLGQQTASSDVRADAGMEAGVLLLTIDPMDHEHRSPTTAKWYDKIVAAPEVVYERLHAGFASTEDSSALTVPEGITLEIAAVLAAGTVDSSTGDAKPCFNAELLVATHPYINMNIAGWSEETVQQHMQSLVSSGLVRIKPSSSSEYEFVDASVQRDRYRSVLHEHRLPIHNAALVWLESQAEGLSGGEGVVRAALYRQLRFHCLCAGEKERARAYEGAEEHPTGVQGERDTMRVVTRQQNQRRFMGGYSSSNLLPTDRPEWCDSSGTASTRNEASLPDTAGDETVVWQWASEWVVDIKPSKTDEDGWRYGRQFSAAGKERRDAGWARDQSAVNVVRARDWIRVALKVPIGRRRRTTTMSSTEGRLIAAQLHSQSLGAITEDDDDEAISASPVAAGTTETRIAALEAENARLQDTIAQLAADPTTSKRGQHVATQQDTSTQRAASPSDASEDLRATRSDMWNVAAGEVLSAVRRVHPVATGVAAHRAKAEWYNSENDFSSAASELLSALTALQSWSAGEQASLSQELAATMAKSAHVKIDAREEDTAAVSVELMLRHRTTAPKLNRAAPAQLAASLRESPLPALPPLPPVPPALASPRHASVSPGGVYLDDHVYSSDEDYVAEVKTLITEAEADLSSGDLVAGERAIEQAEKLETEGGY